jgi:IS30 family transposase
VVVDDFSRYS